MNFEKYLDSTGQFINEVAVELGSEDDGDRAYRVTRAVFQALRERLPFEESLHLVSQLPFLLKAVYVDGWKPHSPNTVKVRRVSDFVEEVRRGDQTAAARDLGNQTEAEQCVRGVLRVIKRHISPGEATDIERSFPKELQSFWANA